MAEPFRKNRRWYLRYKDAQGRWRQTPSSAETKTEVRRLSTELQRQQERVRLGIDEAPAEDGAEPSTTCSPGGCKPISRNRQDSVGQSERSVNTLSGPR